MPTPVALTTHGTITDTEPVDEIGLLIGSVNFTGSRRRQEISGANGCVQVVKERDPKLVISISGVISTSSGLVAAHPGAAVTTLANYGTAANIQGFVAADGVMVYGDVRRSLPQGAQGTIDTEVTQFPFVV
jgi:hypothetical protein